MGVTATVASADANGVGVAVASLSVEVSVGILESAKPATVICTGVDALSIFSISISNTVISIPISVFA